MCLIRVDKTINADKWKRDGKFIICWKVATPSYRRKAWESCHQHTFFKPGWNKSERVKKIKGWVYPYQETIDLPLYIPHFHAFVRKSAATRWANELSEDRRRPIKDESVLRCKTHKKYITATGWQGGDVLVTKKIWIPPYPDKK